MAAIKRVLACRPVNDAEVTWLPPWLRSLPAPQIDATRMDCASCATKIWVGPRHNAAAAAGQGDLTCYNCCRPVLERQTGTLGFVVPRGIADRPRR